MRVRIRRKSRSGTKAPIAATIIAARAAVRSDASRPSMAPASEWVIVSIDGRMIREQQAVSSKQ